MAFDRSEALEYFNESIAVASKLGDETLPRWTAMLHLSDRAGTGIIPHPESAYLKAFLVRITEGLIYTSQLRDFLLKHPLLVIELGFHLELDPSAAYGFDIEDTLPCR